MQHYKLYSCTDSGCSFATNASDANNVSEIRIRRQNFHMFVVICLGEVVNAVH